MNDLNDLTTDHMLRVIAKRVYQLEGDHRLLNELRASIIVNFVRKKTYGVKISEQPSTLQMMLDAFKKLGEMIERFDEEEPGP